MSALSIKNRVEYIILGIAITAFSGWIAYLLVQNGSNAAGLAALIIGLTGVGIGRQLIFFPPDISLSLWWYKSTKPGYYHRLEPRGELKIFRKTSWFSTEVYNLNGCLIGFNEIDPGDDRYDIFVPIRPGSKPQQMPLIAFWRTKRRSMNATQVAQIIDRDNAVVGHTSYSER